MQSAQEIARELRMLGMRPTRPRLSLFALLKRLGECHLDAAEVHRRLQEDGERVALATIYNNLNEFADIGFLRRIFCPGFRKMLFDTNTAPHHHVIDCDTGTISDTDSIDYVLRDNFPIQDDQQIASVEIVITVACGNRKRDEISGEQELGKA
jgi:Fur family transcriptional regulator, iron response regulator